MNIGGNRRKRNSKYTGDGGEIDEIKKKTRNQWCWKINSVREINATMSSGEEWRSR